MIKYLISQEKLFEKRTFDKTKDRLKQEYDKSCKKKDNKYKKLFATYSESKESISELEEKVLKHKMTIKMYQSANRALRKEVRYHK